MRPLLVLLALTLLCGCGTLPATRPVRHRLATFTSSPTSAPSPRRTATATGTGTGTATGAPRTTLLAAQASPPPLPPAERTSVRQGWR